MFVQLTIKLHHVVNERMSKCSRLPRESRTIGTVSLDDGLF